MSVQRLKPKNDFLFKRLFGEEESKELLIALLNAILYPTSKKKIANLTLIENKELVGLHVDDKTGRLDIRCEIDDGQQIDIEVQIARQSYMDNRSLFYLGKLFISSVKKGDSYDKLKKTITINILDFEFIPLERYHCTFHFYEDHDRDFMLTDMFEVHFVECPKFRRKTRDLQDPLQRWLLFLEDKLPEKLRKELMAMDPMIEKAEKRLEWLSSDKETQRLYEAREESLMERNSIIKSAKDEGRAEGEMEEKLKVAKHLVDLGVDIEVIEKATGLSREEIEKL